MHTTTTIRAELFGSDTCKVAGITAIDTAPVLALCRKLLAAGVSPDRTVEVYRGAELAFTIASVGQAANLEINGHGTGFRRLRAWGTGPLVRFNGLGGPL
jgi:hypothetical protein